LLRFDKRITQFAEEKFKRNGIDLKTNFKVVKVDDKNITMTNPATGEIAVPYGMAVWSTGIGTRPIIMDFMKQVGQVSFSSIHEGEKHILLYPQISSVSIQLTLAGEPTCASY
jgi:NADH dehydrogenase FAD-containing subunit